MQSDVAAPPLSRSVAMADTRTSSVLAAPTLLLFREAMVATAVSLAAVATVDRHGHRAKKQQAPTMRHSAARPVPARLVGLLVYLQAGECHAAWSSGLTTVGLLGRHRRTAPSQVVQYVRVAVSRVVPLPRPFLTTVRQRCEIIANIANKHRHQEGLARRT